MLRFHKYQGLGNDFVVVDSSDAAELGAEEAVRLCDRHFGVGADGLLLVTGPTSAEATARMIVLNADGSRPEMCGNGLRCVALHLARRDAAHGVSYVVDTDAGPRLCEVERDGDGALVRTSMGQGKHLGAYKARFGGRELVFDKISMGNPHAVSFDLGLSSAEMDRLGPEVSMAQSGGSNVEFASQDGEGGFKLEVWERGVGRTLACGTGAAATAVAAVLSGRARHGEPIQLTLPGGALAASVTTDSLEVWLRGPARLVFTGETSLT